MLQRGYIFLQGGDVALLCGAQEEEPADHKKQAWRRSQEVHHEGSLPPFDHVLRSTCPLGHASRPYHPQTNTAIFIAVFGFSAFLCRKSKRG